ncbi:DoxX family protein [Verrucomicrobiaceae bacterium R5-34]|uniref:DoxX family protein n=1 Tax=Oceaniferula flava TaxID=2800421 RepID=A0AAE2SD17_9BACT|nr:DoxX family protein [Oceaniferula flavus]MBK1831833.1 DoxX family protein [Verrucomicrobiaceae bacterium R5-34]MBK1856158.1 DoxX family protein [Oceaniferula flavus]MBM1137465.1 DoxX family protein [Oceaniferula flavus]
MNTSDQTLAYTLARLGMGVNLLIHGAVRLPKLSGFANHITGQFEKTVLPAAMVKPYAYAVPFVELGVGILLILGLFTRHTLVAASLLMISLIFGTCLLENWGNAGSQMVYLAYLAALLAFRDRYNQLSLDHKRGS